MSILVDILRAHIVPGLTNLEVVPQVTYRGWIANKSYKMTTPLQSKDFVLDVYSHEQLLVPYAYDINRMAASSFESMHGISPDTGLPKSVGWLIIRCYYSAYFAMHAILRLFGVSCSQFDANESRAVTDIARMYSLQNGNTAASGYYKCQYDVHTSQVYCKQLNNTHQDVWKSFYELIDELATKVSSADFRKKDRDYVIEYLFKLREGLSCRKTLNNGNWLSKVRNEVNYTHSMGAWFPYSSSPDEHEKMFRLTQLWKQAPSEEIIKSHLTQCDQLLFVSTCVSIVSLCHALLFDLHDINKNIFLKHGAIRLANQLN
ncbi:conserved hypothetical protein [Vibrio crassostreae]|nr:conserved hypothetical protein [Vibrio crassostreae]CAK1831349.1 conserved hypothetical protein [Vibrio crassostreae]CAK2302395.1 conserved hypothetical protein [Vibrio crassostreae]CAK2634113.1 conserved hypothetical protein [Vibrio crassostreae]CAK2658754.1 conserved hypothetical protein [Vibrio crassostreae]